MPSKDEIPQWPDSTATDVTAVRGIQIPKGSGYNREEEWMWIEVNEDGTITTYRLHLQVTVEPPEDDGIGDPDE